MESVKAYLDDIERQVAAIHSFEPPGQLPDHVIGSTVFAGSGDSLAAAMLAEAFSNYKARAMDPLEICHNPSILDGRRLYVISVSGRTVANIQLARNHKCTAITAKLDSPLGIAASNIIRLSFPNSDTLTAGSISFLNSALACISLVYPVSLGDVQDLYDRAKLDAAGTETGGRVFFVGDQYTYPIAIYAAAKMYEILGSDAHYSRMEQFSHMELFSAKPGDCVILLCNSDSYTQSLASQLRAQNIHCTVTDPNLDMLHSVIYHTFYAQLLPLNLATGKEVYFMDAKELRGLSDYMIY